MGDYKAENWARATEIERATAEVRREAVQSLRTAQAAAHEQLNGMAIDCQGLIDELQQGYAAEHAAALRRGILYGMTIGGGVVAAGFLLAALL